MKNREALKYIKDFLNNNFQMVIATNGKHAWIATVYYSTDKDLNIYFLSDPNTIHCRHIAKNPKIALSIADSPQKPASKKKGLQIYGLAEKISGMHKIVYALNLWRRTLGVTSNLYTYEGMLKKAVKGRMYKVIPKKIKFFNEELWDEGKEPILEV